MFKVGDKVRFKKEHKKYLGKRWKNSIAEVVDYQEDRHWSRQYCRIMFNEKEALRNYDDVGAWLLEHAE